ncbi:MAG TPA: hypothetical protein VF834_09740 [Streptosporangiaceae bacterium]
MNQKQTDRCVKAVDPPVAADEKVELVEAAQLGKVSVKKQAAVSAVVAVATAGHVIVALRPRGFFVVLTDRRLVLVENNRGIVGKTVASVPRGKISAGPLRGHVLTMSSEVTIDGIAHRFSWGRAQSRMARRVVAALRGSALATEPAA